MSEQDYNLLYFEASSMRKLYECMDSWQKANQKRFLSVSIQQDGGQFCCIALTNPVHVVIADQLGHHFATVDHGALKVYL